jgi:protein-tyrosine phosphatase
MSTTGAVVAVRSEEHRIEAGGLYNLRDLGGRPAGPGRRTVHGVLYRSDQPMSAPGPDLALRTVVDLREEQERARRPAVLGGAPVVAHRPLAVRELVAALPADDPDPLGALYVAALRERGPWIAAAVGELGRPGALPALVHCAAGKDRTGIVVALALSAVGVPDEAVVADFALSADHLTPAFFAGVGGPALPTAVDPVLLRGADPRSMRRLLDELRTRHGGAAAYLLRHGVPAERLDRLRAALVAPDPRTPAEPTEEPS